ncbi:MAG: (d)CMP kinase [Alphaproteobacteria bacterium]|nr:(d)CMP kinase [Alphaproteobacteria bacterium]
MKNNFIVAIDGPAGAGKSTLARKLAEKSGFAYLNTGQLYRSLALFVSDNGQSCDDEAEVENLLPQFTLERMNRCMARQDEITNEIMGRGASCVSRFPFVREKFDKMQKEFVAAAVLPDNSPAGGVIVEGRDTGTKVFPNADVKIFLTASQESRAKRRQLELESKGMSHSFEEILETVRTRDESDINRKFGALRIPEDGTVIDSTGMTMDQVIDAASRLVQDAMAARG